jgi:hypothetical protein
MPHRANEFANAAEDVLAWIARDTRNDYAVSFPNQAKWFQKSNSIGLSRIRRAVERLSSRAARQFMWVALAETIRRCSNSRTSTYKLHIRDEADLRRVSGVAMAIFAEVLKRNVRLMADEKDSLHRAGYLQRGRLRQEATIVLADICNQGQQKRRKANVDVVRTSPPYGDNKNHGASNLNAVHPEHLRRNR